LCDSHTLTSPCFISFTCTSPINASTSSFWQRSERKAVALPLATPYLNASSGFSVLQNDAINPETSESPDPTVLTTLPTGAFASNANFSLTNNAPSPPRETITFLTPP